MLVLGDVFATIAVILFSALAAWAGGMLSAILFPERTKRASNDFLTHPWMTFFIGLGVIVPSFVIATIAFNATHLRPIGAALYVLMLGLAVFGSGGLTRAIASRVRKSGGAGSEFQALAKGGALVIATELLPFFGWFALLPFVLISTFGAGFMALVRGKEMKAFTAPPSVEAQ